MLIQLIVVLVVVGVIVYLANALLPIDARFKLVINCLIGLALFLYVVSALTGHQYLPALR